MITYMDTVLKKINELKLVWHKAAYFRYAIRIELITVVIIFEISLLTVNA